MEPPEGFEPPTCGLEGRRSNSAELRRPNLAARVGFEPTERLVRTFIRFQGGPDKPLQHLANRCAFLRSVLFGATGGNRTYAFCVAHRSPTSRRRPHWKLVLLDDLERPVGIEPTPSVWRTGVLPLDDGRITGSSGRTRTCNLPLNRRLLHHLSYAEITL